MNQYPAGLVPMMVPQQYMVMPSAMQLASGMSSHHHHGALQSAAMFHHQHMASQSAASHATGSSIIASPVTSTGSLSALSMGHQGMVSMAGLPPHMAGAGASVVSAMGGAVPGLHHGVTSGIPTSYAALTSLSSTSALSSDLLTQQQMQNPSQHYSSQHHHRQASPPSLQAEGSRDFRSKNDDKGYSRQTSNRWNADADLELDELDMDESLVILDHFNSDLNLVIDQNGYGGTVLNNPSGFCFTWAGVRATYGVCRGKVFYEVHVTEHIPADFGDDHDETDPHIIRVGWSIDSSSFQLGEEPWSFGYGGTGKFSTNNRFTDYGVRFEEGDVIGAMLDLDSRPASISFMKNGTWYGVAAPLHGFPVGSKDMALFPHILSKNCRFKVNFGQLDAWFPPPMGFKYIGHLPLMERVRGMTPPARKSDCEMVMIVGLPGAGKTTWAINMQKNHPEKRYNIIGTDTLIDKMRVMGLPRKRNYHGRWEVLIDKATKCLNKYFIIAAKRRRNYILDQTNVYGSARKRKMKNFSEFYRIAAVIQPDDPELERRSKKRTQEDGKVVPESAVLEMKANFSLPEDRDNLFDRIDFIELHKDVVQQLVRTYNQEGKPKPRQDSSQNRFDGNKKQVDQRHQPYGGYESRSYDRSASYDKDSSSRNRDHWYSDRDEIPAKRIKPDPGSALDLLKEQYEEDDRQPPAHKGALSRPTWSDPIKIKEERIASPSSQWPPNYSQGLSHTTSFQPGLLGAPPVPNHEAQLAFHHPGMPPPPPSELAGLSLAAKARQDMSVRTGSPYTFGSQATGQNLYEAASPTYEPRVDRQMWHPTEEQQYPTVEQREQQITSWQQEQEEILLKSYAKPWEQDRSSNSWQSDFQDRRDERDFHNRGSGNSRDSSFNRFDSRDRNKDSDRDRDRDRNQDRDYGYNRNSDRGDYYNNDRDHRDGGYSRDSRSSWNSQSYGSSTLDRQDCGSDSGKLDRQRKRKSKWDQPGEDQTASLDQVKHEPDDDAFNNDHSQHAENMYNQPPPGFLGPRFSTSPSQPIRPSSTSRTATNQDTKPTSFDVNYSRQPPPLMGNLKSEFLGTSKDSNTPEIKFSPVGNGGDGLLGQGPGPKSLIAGLQGNLSDQLKAKGSGPPQVGGNDSSRTKNVDSSISSTRKPFSLDANTGKGTDNADDNKRPTPAPLIKMEEEQSSSPPDKDSTSDPSDRARCGQDKPGLFPTPGASEVDVGSSFRPRGPPGLMGRFPGPPTGPQPPVGGPGMLGHGPSSSNMGSRPLRGGPRGPPHGQMGGPPRGPMGGPRGPGPWNQNHPRFGPHGPLRPLFDGPPGRWPRPSR